MNGSWLLVTATAGEINVDGTGHVLTNSRFGSTACYYGPVRYPRVQMSISESAGEHAAWCYLRTGYNWGGDRALKHPLMYGVNRVRGYIVRGF